MARCVNTKSGDKLSDDKCGDVAKPSSRMDKCPERVCANKYVQIHASSFNRGTQLENMFELLAKSGSPVLSLSGHPTRIY